jgi:hypothetical protein
MARSITSGTMASSWWPHGPRTEPTGRHSRKPCATSGSATQIWWPPEQVTSRTERRSWPSKHRAAPRTGGRSWPPIRRHRTPRTGGRMASKTLLLLLSLCTVVSPTDAVDDQSFLLPPHPPTHDIEVGGYGWGCLQEGQGHTEVVWSINLGIRS